MFLRGFEGWHIVIIAGLLVVLFGARKMPDAARSIGQSLRIFKSEMKAARDDTAEATAEAPAQRAEHSAPPAIEAAPGRTKSEAARPHEHAPA